MVGEVAVVSTGRPYRAKVDSELSDSFTAYFVSVPIVDSIGPGCVCEAIFFSKIRIEIGRDAATQVFWIGIFFEVVTLQCSSELPELGIGPSHESRVTRHEESGSDNLHKYSDNGNNHQ